MNIKIIRSVLFIVLVVIVGCSNDNDPAEKVDQQNTRELLTAHPWKFTKQEVNGQSSDHITSPSIPYVAIFNDNGTFSMANFYIYEDTLSWTYDDEQLYVDDQLLNIEEISETKLTISYSDEDDGDVTLYFQAEEPADAFQGDLVYGKYFKLAEADFNSEAQTMENNLSLYRERFFIQADTAIVTEEKLAQIPYTIVSKTFVFFENNGGVDMNVDEEGDLHLVTQDYNGPGVKSANITGNTETDNVISMTMRFTECNPWDFLTGPDWKLTQVEKNGQVATEDIPMELGTIWFFNPLTKNIEERPSASEPVDEYLLWDYVGTPTADNIQLQITIDGGEVLTFTVMQISLTELVFETEYESNTYRFTFSVEVENEQERYY